MIIEGRNINSDSETYGQILIGESGLIEQVGANIGTPDLKTAGLIFPGFVDVHVHAREDASGMQNYKEDFHSMSEAAIQGGVVAVADMPNNSIPPADDKSYAEKQALAQKSEVDVILYAGLGSATGPLSLKAPYKVYMGKSVGNLFFETFAELDEALKNYKGQYVSFHCEDPEILKAHDSPAAHEARRPRTAEISAVNYAIEMIKKHDLQGKLCHISTREGVDLVAKAKKYGVSVTAEVTPHHLYFDESNVSDNQRKLLQVNPPLRTGEDCQALIAGLKSGEIDYLASDHAPHTVAEKQQGISGIPHLDTYGVFTTWLMGEHDFSPQDVARVCAENPGKFINQFLPDKFGRIEVGYVGSLTIIDPDEPLTIHKENLKTKCAWSPFEGLTFPGRVTYTVVRGKIYEN